MRHFLAGSTILPLLAMVAAAQNTEPQVIKRVSIPMPVMGNAIKGAPYAADEITESFQMLADGTKISHQSQVTVYRDGEGRVRRESPTQITIWDAKENVSYTLDPKSMTAVKSAMGKAISFTGTTAADKRALEITLRSSSVEASQAKVAVDTQIAAALDKMKAEMAASGNAIMVNGTMAAPNAAEAMKEQLFFAMEKVSQAPGSKLSHNESLGQRVMEGLTADGTRSTSTIEAGVIGNDRPINIVAERWYSSELQTAVYSKRSDPRTGEEIFRLTNVRRGEPGADLFLLPPGYRLLDTASQKVFVFDQKKEE